MSDQQAQHHSDNQFWIGLFIGGLIGAVLIVLMGTEKGRKLAKKLEEEGFEFWEDTKENIGDKVEELEEKGELLVEKGKEMIEQGKALEEKVIEKAGEIKEDITQEAVARADATLAHIEALQERGRESTAELRKRLFKNIPRKTS